VQTSHSERVSAIISAVLIAAGTALTMAGAHAGGRKIEDRWRAASSGKKKGHPLKMRDARSVESLSEASRYCGGFSSGF